MDRLSARFEHRYRIQFINHCRGNRAGDVLASPVSRPVDINSTDRIRAKVKPWTSKNFPFPLFDPCISSLARKKRNETTDSPHFDSSPSPIVSPSTLPPPRSYLLSSNPSNDSLSAPRLRHTYFSPLSLSPSPGLAKLDEKFLPRARTHLPRFVRKSSFFLSFPRLFLVENKRPPLLGYFSSFDFPFEPSSTRVFIYLPPSTGILSRAVPGSASWR